jgi:nitrogen regulatory protein P-II 1
MKLITAIVRTTSLDHIVQALGKQGITGMTISEIKGIGQEVTLFKPYAIHNRIELYVPDSRADEVVKIILGLASTGLAGDGLLAVQPVDCVIKIRNKEQVECLL